MNNIKIVKGGTYNFYLPGWHLEMVEPSDLEGYYAIKMFYGSDTFSEKDKQYLELCKKNNGKLILDGRMECTVHIRNFVQRNSEYLMNIVSGDTSRIYSITGSYVVDYYKNRERRSDPIYPFCETKIVRLGAYFAEWLMRFQDHAVTLHDMIINGPKKKDFVCLNRRTREHRAHLVEKLIDNDLDEDNYISFFVDDVFYPTDDGYTKSIVDKIASKYPNNMVLDMPDAKINKASDMQWDLYINSRYSLVSETVFYTKDIFFSEKTFKPIVAKHPFIMVNAPFSLASLKEMGLQTFSKWFDESYDNETNHRARMDMIVAEVKRISLLSEDEKNKMFRDMKSVLDHNFKTVYGHYYGYANKFICQNSDMDMFNNTQIRS